MALVTIKKEPESTNKSLQVCRLCLREDTLDDVFKEECLQQWISEYLSLTVSTEDSVSQAICTACRERLTEFHQFHKRCQKVQEVLEFLNQNENMETEAAQLFLKDMLNYGCIKCGKMFVLRQQLEKHKQIHEASVDEVMTDDEQLQEQETDGSNVPKTKLDATKYANSNGSQNLPLAFISGYLATKRVKNLVKPNPQSKKDRKRKHRAKVEKELAGDLVDMIDIDEVKIEAHIDGDMELEKSASTSNEFDGNKPNNESTQEANSNDTIGTEQKKSSTTPTKKEECKICHRRYVNKLLLKSHHKTAHGPKNYKCNVCGVGFTVEQRRQSHYKSSKHLNNVKKLHEKQKLSGKRRSKEHNPEGIDVTSEASVVKNGEEYSCSICNNKFKRLCQFKAHMRSHEIETQKSSDSDGTDSEVVVSDASAHTAKSAQPLETNEVVSDKSAKTSNVPPPRIIIVPEVKPFQCKSCHRSYDTEKQLKNHKGYHTTKRYLCPICGKPFIKMYPLQMHIPSHNAVRDWQRNRATKQNKNVEKPYKCDICQTAYRTSIGYLGHKKQVHGPKIHECHLCPLKYPTRQELNRHIKRKHYGYARS